MALSAGEQNQIKTLMTREGGLEALLDEIRDVAITDKRSTALAALAPAITVTVSDWAALGAFITQSTSANQVTGRTLPSVMAAINAAATARDATQLGPLFMLLYAATKIHLSL